MNNRRDIHLIYLSFFPYKGFNGANTFESHIVNYLTSKSVADVTAISILTVGDSSATTDFDKCTIYQFKLKKSWSWYVFVQLRMFYRFLKIFLGDSGTKKILFIRYHPAMFIPFIFKSLFKFDLFIRTGPIMPNLKVYKKGINPIVAYVINFLCKLHFTRATGIVTVTETIRQWVIQCYSVDPSVVFVVKNGVDESVFTPGDEPFSNISPSLCFVGNVYEDQGLDTVLLAMNHLKLTGKVVPFLLVAGDGISIEPLKKMCVDLDLTKNVTWLGKLDKSKVVELIRRSDLCLAPFRKRVFDVSGSSALKLYEYLSCDKPIMAARGPDHEFIEINELGVLVEPENHLAWAGAITKFIENPTKLKGRGRAYVLTNASSTLSMKNIFELMMPESKCVFFQRVQQ